MNESPASHRIRSISIIGGFLDGAQFDLADGLNCFIGARGTGKTTALEFVRYALDALPGRTEQPVERRRIESLVERNLAGGRVEVTIETKEGLHCIITRSAGEEPIVMTADRQPTEITLKAGGMFRADIYSQNEVETIADRTTSQLVLLDNFEAERMAEIQNSLDEVVAELNASANQIIPLQTRIAALADEIATLAGVEERLQKFATSNGQDAAVINRAHSLKALRDRERRIVTGATEGLQDFAEELTRWKGQIRRQANGLSDPDVANGPNAALLQGVLEQVTTCGVEVDRRLVDVENRISDAHNIIANLAGRLHATHKMQELEFRSLIEQHQQAQGQASERAQLERRRNELLAKSRQRDQWLEQLQDLQIDRESDLLEQVWHSRGAPGAPQRNLRAKFFVT